MKKAMITIEALVALLILFLAIATSVETIKFFQIIEKKKISIEDEYMIVLNIKSKLSNKICKNYLKKEGELNGYTYKATCKRLEELRSYKIGFDIGDPSGNTGRYLMKFYEVDLVIKKDDYNKSYVYYVTVGSESL